MSKICAKCEKPVYPTEELKCLDKVWHKTCFKCWECGMSLSMKNYKGYEKKPYCVAHYPQTKATVVAETPEMARLTQASKNQSQAKYHEEFEKKIKGSKIQVTDDPETQRLKQLNTIVSQVEYKGIKEKVTDMEARRQNVGQSDASRPSEGSRPQSGTADETNWSSPYADRSVSHSTMYSNTGKVEQPQARKIGSISDFEPTPGPAPAPYSAYQPIGTSSRQRQEWEETVPMSSTAPYQQFVTQQQQQAKELQMREQQARDQQVREQQARDQQMREQQARDQQMREQQARDQQMREQQAREQQMREQQARDQQMREQQAREQQMREQQARDQQMREQQARDQQMREQQAREQQAREQQIREQQVREHQLREQQMREQQMRQQQQQQQQAAYVNQQATRVPPVNAPLSGGFAGPVFQAMYDYDAQDDDEVSFRENDLVVNVEPIDEGWMFGTIQRTGMRGMLPANYVERIK